MTATLVELIDGRIVLSDGEEWRIGTLARHVLNLPSDAAELDWLTGFEKQSGAEEAQRLRDRMDTMRRAPT